MDFTKLDLQRIRSIISYKGVTLRASYARYKCMGALYYKLAAFIPNTKDILDFCLGGLKAVFLG